MNQGTPQGKLINPNSVITIPVVVHIIHAPGEAIGVGRNISIAQVQSQIDVLNEDFRRLNPDRINTPNVFTSVAADPGIEFRLACQGPNGDPTNGITRTASSVTAFSDNDNIKSSATGGHDAWPTDRYLNIWVSNLSGGLLGYAQFPFDYATRPNTDGVVIHTTAFGRVGNVVAPFNTGRAATHEVGHWLNLFHIWGDDGNGCNGSDQCDDTPNQADENFGCPAFPSTSCNNNGDMSMNYMDYTDDACMNIYTNDQRTRMRANFAQGGSRAAFINNYFRINQPSTYTVCAPMNLSVLNPTCLPVTWTVISGNITITAGQNTNTVTLSPTGSGTAVVRVQAAGYFDEITFSVGTPVPDFLNFFNGAGGEGYFCSSHYGNGFVPFFLSGIPANASIEYRVLCWPSLNVVYTDPTAYTLGGSIPVYYMATPGSYIVLEVKLNTPCGSSSWTGFEVQYVDCSEPGGGCPDCPFRLVASPNPTDGDLNVTIEKEKPEVKSLNKNEKVRYTLYDFSRAQVVKQWTFDNGQNQRTISVRGVKAGQYVLVVTKGQYRQSTQIIIR